MFGGYIFPFFAAIYFWFPKLTGKMYNERLGKIHFWFMLLGFYVQTLVQMQVGLLGMRRRIVDYDPALGINVQQFMITVAAFVIATGVLVFIINMILSVRRGEVAVANPWNSRSPEWQIPSPIPAHNYDVPIEVVGEPYDYGLAGSVYTATTEPPPAAAAAD
jgi:cytochrome c oxidase subunit 1